MQCAEFPMRTFLGGDERVMPLLKDCPAALEWAGHAPGGTIRHRRGTSNRLQRPAPAALRSRVDLPPTPEHCPTPVAISFWSHLAGSEQPCRPAAGKSSSAARVRSARLVSDRAASTRRPRHREFVIQSSLQVGKYLVSPLTSSTHCGRYAASVSIRSGHGSTTHDRVLRLLPVFDSRDAAERYATAQGLAWIGAPASRGTPFSTTFE
mgnify:CR=1 FL=1